MVYELLKFILFPGALFVIVFAVVGVWLLRKFTAKLEDRVGPPFLQPLFDFAKLLAKERVYPARAMKNLQHYLPIFQFSVALIMAFFLPIYSIDGKLAPLFSFEGDVFFFLFLLGLHGVAVFFIGWSAKNPYAQSGAGRAVMIEMSLEIPLALSVAAIAIMTKSMRITEITDEMSGQAISFSTPSTLWLIIPWIIIFAVSIIASLGALELNPFSAAHAETEIVAGWMTELTGPDLALVKLSEFINLFSVAGLLVCIFLGGPTTFESIDSVFLEGLIGFLTFTIKWVIVIFLLSFFRTLTSRMRIDQTSSILWTYLLPISIIGVLIVLVIL